MIRTTVSSSNIASIGYDDESSILEVEFLNGGIYQYFDVPKQIFEEFIGSASHGKYLAEQIKGNFRFSKV